MRETVIAVIIGCCLLVPLQSIAGGTKGSGVKMVGSEFRVNSITTANQTPVSVIMEQDGTFEVTYRNYPSYPYGNFYTERFDAFGNVIGWPAISSYAPQQISTNNDGSFIQTWYVFNWGKGAIYAQIFNSMRIPISDVILVKAESLDLKNYAYCGSPSAAIADDGTFIVSWHQFSDATGKEAGYELSEIWAKRFDEQGTPIGKEFHVNTTAYNYQYDPLIALAGDSFVIIWASKTTNGDWDVFGQRFSTKEACR